jgi:hypothetical protein
VDIKDLPGEAQKGLLYGWTIHQIQTDIAM